MEKKAKEIKNYDRWEKTCVKFTNNTPKKVAKPKKKASK